MTTNELNEKEKNIIDNNDKKPNKFLSIFNKFYDYNYPKKNWKKASDATTWSLVGILCTLVIAVILILMIGFKPAVVMTPSMKPNINPGSLVFYKQVDAETLKVNDVITFYSSKSDKDKNATSWTHRIIEIIENADGTYSFKTKGDNNNTADSAIISEDLLLGKVQFIIPWIGTLFFFIKNHLLIIVGAIISLVIFYYLVKTYLAGRKENENNKDQNNEDKNGKDNKEEKVISSKW